METLLFAPFSVRRFLQVKAASSVLASGLVQENVSIYEASVCTPTLQDVYYAFVKKPGEETPHEEAVL